MRFLQVQLLMIIFLGLSFCVIGQSNNRLDSLDSVVKTSIPDSTKLDILYELAVTYQDVDFEKSIMYSNQLLALSQKIDNQLYVGVAYNLIGMTYLDEDYGLDTIITLLEKGFIIAESVENFKLKAIISNGMAMTYDKFGQKEKALLLYQQAYRIFNESGNKKYAIRCLGNLALVLKTHGDLETAKKYYLQAIDIAKEIEDEVMVSQLGNNLATVYYEQNHIDSALTLYEKSVEVNKAVGNQYFTSLSLANIGRIYNKKGLYEIALSHLKESYEIASDINDTYCMGTALTFLCQNYEQQKQYSKAIRTAKEALDILGENGDLLTRTEFYKYLSNSYEAQGNYELAFKNQKIYHTFSDSLYNAEKSEQINDLRIKYEVEQKEAENKLLKTKSETAQRIIKNQTFAAIGLGLALLLAIGWGFYIYRANRQRKQLNEILEEKVELRTAELQQSNKNLEQANYELRTFNYIASHDIKEPIRVIGGYAGLVFKKLPNDLKESLGEYFDTIKRSTNQLYTLIEDFAHYTTMSKNETIKKEAVDLNQLLYGVIDNLQESIHKYKGEIIINHLPTIQSSNSLLFTTLKNLIENGLKYNKSENPTVNIDYSQTLNHHQIIVSDNGIGIKKEYHEKIFEMFKRLHNRGAYEGSGIGLAIVKLVTEKLGGTVELESKSGKGTRFILHLSK